MQLGYGYSYFNRELGNFKETTVINMIAEQIQGEETPSLISRPGLVSTGVTVGTGPVTAMYAISGVFDDDMFVVSGTEERQRIESDNRDQARHVQRQRRAGYYRNLGQDRHPNRSSAHPERRV